MRVQVAYVGQDMEALVTLDVATGATVADAVAQSGLLLRIDRAPATLGYAIFGRRVEQNALLAEHDRVEITRPLARDPKAARRRRAARPG
jgi:putative ubiquitin-RnfH superfamily antitoxin RatB of RatAB toxin-antitoxin module